MPVSGQVNILLPTYNGRRYLAEFLQSVLDQSYADIALWIRDDGSTDETYSQLCAWAGERSDVHLSCGMNIGATPSFFHLLQNTDRGGSYFAFADQDDVWLPDKVERAVEALGKHDLDDPVMYCTRIEYVDEHLGHLGYSKIPRHPQFANALVESVATGCTMVLNRGARELVCGNLPQNVPYHDWWCYLVISAMGTVIYDERPSIKYRQHANNVTGAATTQWEHFRRRFTRFLKQKRGNRLMSDQAVEFQRCFGDQLGAQDRKTLERFLSVRGTFGDRLSYSAVMDVWRQSWPDTMILRALILMGRA